MPPELTGAAEPVASKRNLFEAGEAWNQNVASAALSKVLERGSALKNDVQAGHKSSS